MTLRDAQHICWKNFRKIQDQIDPEAGKNWKPSVTVTELQDHLGKLLDTINKSESTAKDSDKNMIGQELSDLIYLTLILAEYYRIELEDIFLETVNDRILSRIH